MTETIVDRPALLRAARDAAREAAALAGQGYRTHPDVEHKGRIDLVTRFDRESETLLRDRLSKAAPYPVVGEEQGGERGSGADALTWYVDPIDGTTNFVHGHPFWCVSVGLLAGSRPVLGVVVAPALGMEWEAIVGGEAKRGGAPCRVSDASTLDDAMLATGFPYDLRTSPENNLAAFMALMERCQAVRRCGSAALDLCLVADGGFDGYWEQKLKPWDWAAGAAIVTAAGGRISNYEGHPMELGSGKIVATNGRIHDDLLAELAKVRRPER
ncbi:MAG: inositol monophosphatase family protein [Polyangiaceae bacterium]